MAVVIGLTGPVGVGIAGTDDLAATARSAATCSGLDAVCRRAGCCVRRLGQANGAAIGTRRGCVRGVTTDWGFGHRGPLRELRRRGRVSVAPRAHRHRGPRWCPGVSANTAEADLVRLPSCSSRDRGRRSDRGGRREPAARRERAVLRPEATFAAAATAFALDRHRLAAWPVAGLLILVRVGRLSRGIADFLRARGPRSTTVSAVRLPAILRSIHRAGRSIGRACTTAIEFPPGSRRISAGRTRRWPPELEARRRLLKGAAIASSERGPRRTTPAFRGPTRAGPQRRSARGQRLPIVQLISEATMRNA